MFEVDRKIPILILGSNRINTGLVESLLEQEGFAKATVFESAIDALGECQRGAFEFAIVDFEAKFMTGWQFVREMKDGQKCKDIPMILMGSKIGPVKKSELIQYGVSEFLALPCTSRALLRLIESTLLIARTSGTNENKYAKAKNALLSKKTDLAIEIYTDLRTLSDQFLRSSFGLANAYVQKSDTLNAKRIADEIADQSPADAPAALMLKLQLAIEKGDAPEIGELAVKLLGHDPSSPYYCARAAEALFQSGDLDQAESICRAALANGFALPDFYFLIAKCHLERGRPDLALEILSKGNEVFGLSVAFLNLIGICYRKLGKISEAKNCYEQAYQLVKDPRILFNLALCSIAMDDTKTAVAYLEEAVALEPGFEKAKEKLAALNQELSEGRTTI
jgi:tetratricopeptide (TPR) repeat protein